MQGLAASFGEGYFVEGASFWQSMYLRVMDFGKCFGWRHGSFPPVLLMLLITAAFGAAALPGSAENVVAYEIVDGREIPASLTGAAGNAEAGQKLYLDDRLARCAGCHGVPVKEEGPDSATNGAPSLADVGARLSEGAIRLSLIAPDVLRPATRMPSYYDLGQRADPADPRYGEPLLTAEEIEDLVAYLMEQRGDQP